jgi:hypothetical protein
VRERGWGVYVCERGLSVGTEWRGGSVWEHAWLGVICAMCMRPPCL